MRSSSNTYWLSALLISTSKALQKSSQELKTFKVLIGTSQDYDATRDYLDRKSLEGVFFFDDLYTYIKSLTNYKKVDVREVRLIEPSETDDNYYLEFVFECYE